MSSLQPGALVGEYQLRFPIGRGGMGQVWAAEQTVAGQRRMVALKVLPLAMLEGKLKALFLDEARVARALSHPNIVSAFDVGSDGDLLYMAMELVPGPSLSVLLQQLVRANRSVEPGALVSVGLDILDALVYAHDEATAAGRPLRLVHRDVSPQNVLVRPGGATALADFGVARSALQTHETTAGTIRGKPAYMSPEQVASVVVDARSDLFSLGVVLYELAVRRRLFGRKNLLLTMQAVTSFVPPPIVQYRPELPAGLQRVIHRLLEKKPEDRFQSAQEARTALAEVSTAAAVEHGRAALWGVVAELMSEHAFDISRHAEKALAGASDTEPDARPGALSASLELGGESPAAESSSQNELWPTIAASHPLDDDALTDAGWKVYFDDLEVAPLPRARESTGIKASAAEKPISLPLGGGAKNIVTLRPPPDRPSMRPSAPPPRAEPPPPATAPAANLPMVPILGFSAIILGLGAWYASTRSSELEPETLVVEAAPTDPGAASKASAQGSAHPVASPSPAPAGASGASAASSEAAGGEVEDAETLHRRLILAVERGDVAAVKNGIKGGIGLARVDEKGWTILHAAAYRGQTQIAEALLEAGADPNAAASEGWTPLHLAAQGGHVDSATTLLRHGGKPVVKTDSGDTPMHVVATSKPATSDRIITLLVRHGAKADELDFKGFTPVDAAVDHDCVACMEGFFRTRAPLSQKAGDGVTPLWRAAYLGRTKIAAALINKGAVAPAVGGVSASEIARQRGHHELARILSENGQ